MANQSYHLHQSHKHHQDHQYQLNLYLYYLQDVNNDGIVNELDVDETKKQKASGTSITSPTIIGTAYHAPEPGAKRFVEIGKKIKKGDTIMIIEAMKTMNHVPSTLDGVVSKILVKDHIEEYEYENKNKLYLKNNIFFHIPTDTPITSELAFIITNLVLSPC